MQKKRGRPRKENRRDAAIRIRLTKEEYDMVQKLSEEHGKTMSEFFRSVLNERSETND